MKYILPFLPLVLGFLAGIPCPMKRSSEDFVGSYIPPGWMFAVMWSIIYICLGGFVYQLLSHRTTNKLVWGLLALNMIFNLSWTYIYSKSCLGKKELALWWLFMCKLSLLALIVAVLTSSTPKLAFWLVLYYVWLDIAMLLNYQALSKGVVTN